MSLVLDSSITVARVFPDEWTPEILRIFDEDVIFGAWVPGIWRIEIANVLTLSVRRGRMTQVRRDEAFNDLEILPIVIDPQTGDRVWQETTALADRHRLTVYDATYLELALRKSLPLATLDRELRLAAQAEGITLLGL